MNECAPTRITEPTPTVRLRNGSEANRLLVHSVMEFVEAADRHFGRELVALARDPGHVIPAATSEALWKRGFLIRTAEEPWTAPGAFRLPGVVRNILLSAAEGEGADMRLVDPIAESEARR